MEKAAHPSDPIDIRELAGEYTRKLREYMTAGHLSLEEAEEALLRVLRDYGRLHA